MLVTVSSWVKKNGTHELKCDFSICLNFDLLNLSLVCGTSAKEFVSVSWYHPHDACSPLTLLLFIIRVSLCAAFSPEYYLLVCSLPSCVKWSYFNQNSKNMKNHITHLTLRSVYPTKIETDNTVIPKIWSIKNQEETQKGALLNSLTLISKHQVYSEWTRTWVGLWTHWTPTWEYFVSHNSQISGIH